MGSMVGKTGRHAGNCAQIKSGSVLFVLLLTIFLASASFASVNPKIELRNYTVSEVPAVPGHVVNITLYLKSVEWDNCAERVAVQLVTTYPLSVQGPDMQYIGPKLCENDSDAKGTLSFLLPVDALAQTGTYQVNVLTTYEKRFAKFSESNTLNVRVGGAPSFVASVTSSQPVDIYAGDSAAVTITFQNNGSSTVQSSRVELSAPEGIEVKWAGQQQELGSIPPRGSTSATFSIEALKDTAPGNYTLTAKLNYVGEDKLQGASVFKFEMPVKPKADFSTSLAGNKSLIAGDDAEIQLVLRNTGTQEARSLKARIKPIFPFSTDGTVRYVDSLKPGEEQILTYVVHVDKDGTAGSQIAGVLVDFEDPQGNKFSDSNDFALSVRAKSAIERLLDFWYLGAIALLAVGIVLVRTALAALRKKDKEK